jgi:hypothetical protein
MSRLPHVMLWAWERREDLSFSIREKPASHTSRSPSVSAAIES